MMINPSNNLLLIEKTDVRFLFLNADPYESRHMLMGSENDLYFGNYHWLWFEFGWDALKSF